MSKSVGKSVVRVDAYEKATGRAKYMDDLCDRSALVAKICHSTIAHGYVKSIDVTEAEAVPGVVRVLTCFDVPDIPFPTAGHPWSMDPGHQDVADRHLLNRHVETGQYLHHAGDLLRRRGVHRLDEAVGDGGVLDADIQCITGHEVLVVLGAAGGLIKGVYPHLGFSYFSHVVFLLMSASLR